MQTIALEDMKTVMREVTREITPMVISEGEDKEAISVLLGSMVTMMADIFAHLPDEDRSHILVNCATWYDIGLLAGRSPGKLKEILDRVDPAIEEVCLQPDWLEEAVRGLTRG